MQRTTAADELAMIRARITRLKAREAEISDALIEGGEAACSGRWTQARVIKRRVSVFDHRLLPIDVQADLAYWHDETRVEIVLEMGDGRAVPQAHAEALPGAYMDTTEAHLVAWSASG
ncbi:hypothetical protein [Pararhodobacter sp. CCB-MM2]|uniref:hypothetical protein n=1 Tax=Pararhodobacter sp. CCB-MM2 TaxID=1786003 RepID=UPI0008358BD4|nr:hypothetical protein [Pararhodobacter sp. CCB-MM2]MCA2010832.1 hypothetical protein [Cereibacter sphaeroides]